MDNDLSNIVKPSAEADITETCVRSLQLNGYATIERVFDASTISMLKNAYLAHFERFVAETTDTNKNGHFRMDLPFKEPFIETEVVANPRVLPIVKRLLGNDCICQYFASNTCMPGSMFQNIHSDLHPLYPGSDIALPVPAIVLNIALVDFHANNGPTEIWPGTHLITEGKNNSEYIQETAELVRSTHVHVPEGSVILRDLRMWHRGTPNRSNQPRPMIALVYFRHWFGAQPLSIPSKAYETMSEPVKYLFRKALIS